MPTYLKHSHMAKRRYTTILFHTLWHSHTFLSFGHCSAHLADISILFTSVWCIVVSAEIPYCLGGSHILTALQGLHREYCANSRALPDWLQHVYREEIKHECPVDIEGIIGGDHNAVQHSVTKLSMGQVAARIWTEVHTGKAKVMLLVPLRKCGRLGEKTSMV